MLQGSVVFASSGSRGMMIASAGILILMTAFWEAIQ